MGRTAIREVTVNAPSDPAMARLWSAALAKFATRTGRDASTREDLREVTTDYQRMAAKPRGRAMMQFRTELAW